jgi:hypothetical protein
MSDLIERLREMRPDFIQESHAIMQEAADEIERLTKIEKAAIALRDDMILRADIGTFDGDHSVQAGASVWRNFCNALDVGKIIHCNQQIPRGVEE